MILNLQLTQLTSVDDYYLYTQRIGCDVAK